MVGGVGVNLGSTVGPVGVRHCAAGIETCGVFATPCLSRKVLILDSPTLPQFCLSRSRLFGCFAPLLRCGLGAEQVQFDGTSYGHGRISHEKWSDQRLKPFHLFQLLPIGFLGCRRSPGIGIEFDLSLQRSDGFAVLLQGVLLNFGRDVLKTLKLRQWQPALRRIRSRFFPSSIRGDAIDKPSERTISPSIEQRPMVQNDELGNFRSRHRIQRIVNDPLQLFVGIHGVKYAPNRSTIQGLHSNGGTTTAHRYSESGSQANGGLSPLHTKGKQQVMSDAVLIALISGTPGVVASIIGFLNQVMIRRANAIGEKAVEIGQQAATIGHQAATLGARAAELGEKNEQHLAETKKAMVTLEQNTNSIKDELVRVTGISKKAEGNLEGRKEMKAELDLAKGESEEHSG